MFTLRAIKPFLVIGWIVMTAMLFSACSARVVPAVVSNQPKFIPLGTTFLTTQSVSSVFSVACSPDGKHLALGYADGTVQVCDATTGDHAFTYRGHTNYVWAVAWSSDGQTIASGGMDDTVQVWNSTTGKRILTYYGHTSAIQALAWSPDGKRLASVDDQVRVWQAS